MKTVSFAHHEFVDGKPVYRYRTGEPIYPGSGGSSDGGPYLYTGSNKSSLLPFSIVAGGSASPPSDSLSHPASPQATVNIGNLPVIDLRGKLPHGPKPYDLRDPSGSELDNLGKIRFIVIHHSGVVWDSTAEEIASYQVNVAWASPGVHFREIAYAFLVHWDGRIDYCVDMTRMSWHVASNNATTLGICLPGNWMRGRPSMKQLERTAGLVANIQLVFNGVLEVKGHREVALPQYATSCPGDTFLAPPTIGWKKTIGGKP